MILNPNPDAMSKMITENASEEFLQTLSNYCALQVSIPFVKIVLRVTRPKVVVLGKIPGLILPSTSLTATLLRTGCVSCQNDI
ncbi:hypothetical protein PIB30_042437 [Stylosanthes scabra]|uniref:Uncharacterized protein n=1 Tax=Stylosanthes scabra TaxID=79078 RepID=A0ABU6SFX8_9FABA|nr:hypothetical protein [Stylosanthes scabra]